MPSVILIAGAFGCHEKPTPQPPASAAILPFVENDAPKALADAKTRHVPVFVEAWAPW